MEMRKRWSSQVGPGGPLQPRASAGRQSGPFWWSGRLPATSSFRRLNADKIEFLDLQDKRQSPAS